MNNEIPFIVFVGNLGSGKTEGRKYVEKKYNYVHGSFAESLRHVIAALYGIHVHETRTQEQKAVVIPKYGKTVGQLLVEIGMLLRSWNEDIFVNAFELNWQKEGCPHMVVDDARFLNEYHCLKNRKAIFIKLVGRDGYTTDARDPNSPSERSLDHVIFEHIINNIGTKKELYDAIDTILAVHGIEKKPIVQIDLLSSNVGC